MRSSIAWQSCWSSFFLIGGACCWLVEIPMAHAAQTNNEQGLSLVTSSSFEMIISPTLEELDAEATSKLKAAMEATLFSQALFSTALSSVFDMDIGLQQIDWTTSQESIEVKSSGSASIKLQFIVLATFFKNNDGDSPSLYALDTHIVQTFSQPSRKSSFVSMLVTSNEPLLSQVTDINVALIDTTNTSPTSAPGDDEQEETGGSKSLSSLDIILIVASTSIFFGIVYMIYQHHKDRVDMNERQARSWNNRDPRSFTTPRRRGGRQLVNHPQEQNGGSTSVLKCNIEVYDGDDEFFDEEAQAPPNPLTTHSQPKEDPEPGSPPLFRKLKFTTPDNIEAMPPSPPMSPASFSPMSSVSSHTTSSTQDTGSPHLLGAPMPIYTTENPPLSPSSAPSLTTYNIEAMPPSPPMSPASFSPMPSVSSHTTSSTQDTGSPHLLGAPMPIYTTENPPLSPSSAPSPLSPRLLSLPNMTPDDGKNLFRVSYPRSVKSAPVFSCVQSSDSSARAQIGETHPSSIPSSSDSSSSSASVCSGISSASSERSTAESVASVDVNSTGTDIAEFDDNWFKAKAKELFEEEEEDDDEDSLEDAFQADTENNVFRDHIDENRSGKSAVTEWAKSIPAVIQSHTSESTNSSTEEHSYVEPEAAHISEHGSVDNSLEHSLATSHVEV